MSENIVEVRDLRFSYGDLEVFRGLSLGIARGKVVGIRHYVGAKPCKCKVCVAHRGLRPTV